MDSPLRNPIYGLRPNKKKESLHRWRQRFPQQLDLFTDYEELERKKKEEQAALDKERRMQEAQLAIKHTYRQYYGSAILTTIVTKSISNKGSSTLIGVAPLLCL